MYNNAKGLNVQGQWGVISARFVRSCSVCDMFYDNFQICPQVAAIALKNKQLQLQATAFSSILTTLPRGPRDLNPGPGVGGGGSSSP